MNAIELLKRQHREVDQLFNQFERALDAPKSKHAILELIADSLRHHTEIEEKIFYPASRYRKTSAQVDRAIDEHQKVEQLLAEVLKFKPEEADYDAKARELRAAVQAHVQEEEQQLFPKVAVQLGRLRLEELGTQMEALERDIQTRQGELAQSGLEVSPEGAPAEPGEHPEGPGVHQ